jgi:hypothetical protein
MSEGWDWCLDGQWSYGGIEMDNQTGLVCVCLRLSEYWRQRGNGYQSERALLKQWIDGWFV